MIILNVIMLGSGGLALCCMLASRERSITAWVLHLAMTISMVLCALPGARTSLVGLTALISASVGGLALWRWRHAPGERHPMQLHRALSSLLMAGAVIAHVGLTLISGNAPLSAGTPHAGHGGSGNAQLFTVGILLTASFAVYTICVVRAEIRASTRSHSRIGETAAMGLGVIAMSVMPTIMLSA